MNRQFLHLGYVALMLCVLFTACKKADVTATATDPQLTFALMPDNFAYTFTATTSVKPTFTWTAGIANITRFRLNAKRGGVAAEYSSANLNNVDLFNLGSLLSTISIPKGDYNGVKAAVVFSQTTAAPYPLVLSGTFTTAAGTAIPVEFDLNDNLEISVGVSDIIADGTKDFTTNIALHLNQFIIGIAPADLDAATRTNGAILISRTVNTTLYAKIKANMLLCGAAALSSKAK
jgi:hypothetical protein